MIVVWRITEKCNLACDFCAYDRRLSFPRRDVLEDTVLRFSKILGDYQRTFGDKILPSWIGGEPLLWEPLFGLSKQLKKEHNIDCSVTTNGTTLHSPDVRSAVLNTFTEITVSIDGLEKYHNQVRHWKNGWKRLATSICALARERREQLSTTKLRANVVLMHDNLCDFAELCEYLAGWGIDEITFNQLGGRDRPEFYANHRLTPSDAFQLKEIIPHLQQKMESIGVRLCGNEAYLDRVQASARNQKLAISNCSVAKKFLFIDERGLVSPCNFTSSEIGVPIEEIGSVSDFRELSSIFSLRLSETPHAACFDCPSTQVFAKFGS